MSTLIMDSARRISQSKTTKGLLNPPYNRFGCLFLRIRRRIQNDYDSKKKVKTQPGKQVASACILYSQALFFPVESGILLLGSLRLESGEFLDIFAMIKFIGEKEMMAWASVSSIQKGSNSSTTRNGMILLGLFLNSNFGKSLRRFNTY